MLYALQTGDAKLRAYAQVYNLYLNRGDISSALELLKKMRRGHTKVPLQAEQFVQLIAVAAEQGYFR